MQIIIKIFAIPYRGKSITLQVEPDDTIENIKAKIQDKLGIEPDCQILTKFLSGKKYDHDDYTLRDYDIYDNATLSLYPIAKYTLCYVFYNDLGDKFEIKTYNKYDNCDVKTIKEAIYEILGIVSAYQQLSFNGRILDDNSSINIGAEIKLTIKMNGKIFEYLK